MILSRLFSPPFTLIRLRFPPPIRRDIKRRQKRALNEHTTAHKCTSFQSHSFWIFFPKNQKSIQWKVIKIFPSDSDDYLDEFFFFEMMMHIALVHLLDWSSTILPAQSKVEMNARPNDSLWFFFFRNLIRCLCGQLFSPFWAVDINLTRIKSNWFSKWMKRQEQVDKQWAGHV